MLILAIYNRRTGEAVHWLTGIRRIKDIKIYSHRCVHIYYTQDTYNGKTRAIEEVEHVQVFYPITQRIVIRWDGMNIG